MPVLFSLSPRRFFLRCCVGGVLAPLLTTAFEFDHRVCYVSMGLTLVDMLLNLGLDGPFSSHLHPTEDNSVIRNFVPTSDACAHTLSTPTQQAHKRILTVTALSLARCHTRDHLRRSGLLLTQASDDEAGVDDVVHLVGLEC